MWHRFGSIIVGVWLTAAPDVLGFDGFVKANNVICGALASAFATIAIWETTRGLRWLNFAIGLWLLVSLFIFGYAGLAFISNLVGGIMLVSFALIRGVMTQQAGGGWRSLWKRSDGSI